MVYKCYKSPENHSKENGNLNCQIQPFKCTFFFFAGFDQKLFGIFTQFGFDLNWEIWFYGFKLDQISLPYFSVYNTYSCIIRNLILRSEKSLVPMYNTLQRSYNVPGGVQGSKPRFEWYCIMYFGTEKSVLHPLVKINLLHMKFQQCLS